MIPTGAVIPHPMWPFSTTLDGLLAPIAMLALLSVFVLLGVIVAGVLRERRSSTISDRIATGQASANRGRRAA